MNDRPPNCPEVDGDGAARRSFLTHLAAGVCGGIVALFPFASGFGVLFDPLRRGPKGNEKAGESATSQTAEAGFVRICPLAALAADGVPHAFPVHADVIDAWSRATNQRIGMIFLSRTERDGKPHVTAFNAECPHLGCFVDFNPADQRFECPCHESAFAKDGAKLFGPSRRGLDALAVRLDSAGDVTEVWVAFAKFQKGIESKVSAG